MKKLSFYLSCALGSTLLLSPTSVKAHDWVDYGPLKVNIRGWKLNTDRLRLKGVTTYDTNFINTRRNTKGNISVDCVRDRITTTKGDGTWRRYRISLRKNEKTLKNDFCTAIRKNPLLFN